MGCCGDREKGVAKQEQKWDYITLSDFKATSTWNTVAFVWLWIMFISEIVVYAVDTFTAVNLLVFNRWSSQVKPYIPFEYSKWIFAGCILFSWALWIFEWIRAIRVIKRGVVAESYMDPLAASLQSMRGKGWRRFLVFAELTKSKKGSDLTAFFVYFAFKGAIRIILAEGPRQVINTMTLVAVIKADFVDKNAGSHATGISLFWDNIQALYNANHMQAIILCAMMYTLAIWVISVIILASAALCYIIFLWHFIPSHAGGLSRYCRSKVDRRLERIVAAKVKAGIEEEERKRRKAEEREWKAEKKAEMKRQKTGDLTSAAPPAPLAKINRQPTLPQLDDGHSPAADDRLPEFPLNRQNSAATVATLPQYSSRPPTRNDGRPTMDRQPTLPGYPNSRPGTSRTFTEESGWSNTSYEADAPLLANAGYAGSVHPPPSRPGTAFSRKESNSSMNRPPPMPRSMTSGTQRSFTPARGMDNQQRAFSPMLRTDFSQTGRSDSPVNAERSQSPFTMDPQDGRGNQSPANYPPRQGNMSPAPYYRQGSQSPAPNPPRQANQTPFNQPPSAMSRTMTNDSMSSAPRSASFSRPMGPFQRPSQTSFSRPYSPAPMLDDHSASSADSYEMKSNLNTNHTASNAQPSGGYVAFNPGRSSPAPSAQTGPALRNFSTPSPEHVGQVIRPPPQRSMTAPIEDHRRTIGYSDIVDDYSEPSSQADLPRPPPAAARSHNDWKSRF